MDSSGGLYLPSRTSIRYINAQGVISTIATSAALTTVLEVKLEPQRDDLLIINDGCYIKRVNTVTGVVEALSSSCGTDSGTNGDNGPLNAASFTSNNWLCAFDNAGNLLAASFVRLRKVAVV